MQLFNQTELSPGWLVGRLNSRALTLSVALKGTFRLQPGEAAIPAEKPEALEGDIPEAEAEAAIRYPADLVPIKSAVDLLLVGTAHAPEGKAVPVFPVEFGVGAWHKRLMIVGPSRQSRGLLGWSASVVQPITSQALGWRFALGGAEFSENPVGCGRSEVVDARGERVIPWPGIVRPADASAAPADQREPAGFGPFAPSWPQRMNLARRASYDAGWLQSTWPGFPAEFDFGYFNSAPSDQRLPLGTVAGGETISLKNLLAGHPVFEGLLPGIRPRWFVEVATGDDVTLREIVLQIDTLWVDSDEGKLVLVWRGVGPLATKRQREVRAHLMVQESLAESPRPFEYYQELLARLRAASAAEAEIKVAEVSPPTIEPVQPRTIDWAAWSKQFDADMKGVEEDLEKEKSRLDQMLAEDLARSEMQKHGFSPAHFAQPPVTDPTKLAEAMKAAHLEMSETNPGAAQLMGPPPTAADLEVDAAFLAAVEEIKEAEKIPLPEEDEGEQAPPATDPALWTRERCESHAGQGGDFIGQDLSGLDLSGLEFSGLDFSGAILRGTRLAECGLERARFDGAVLAEADATQARLGGASAVEVDATGLVAPGADLSGADFSRAVLSGANLHEIVGLGTLFPDVVGPGLDLGGARLAGANFSAAILDQARLAGADLSGADLSRASAPECVATGARFDKATMTNFRAPLGQFGGASLAGIDAAESIWEEACLDGALFLKARLRQSSFTAASLRGTHLSQSDLSKCRFSEAIFEDAVLVKANLFRATLEDARIVRTDFRGASLYEVEVLDAQIVSADFSGANLKGTKLV